MTAKTTRILKEAHPLFWPWCAVAVTAALPLFCSLGPIGWVSMAGFFLGMPILATLPLGNEFQHQTLSAVLSQPISRMEIWSEKFTASLMAVLPVSLISILTMGRGPFRMAPHSLALATAWIVVTVASATYWTLFTRSIAGGVVLNIAIPSFIFYAVNMAAWLLKPTPAVPMTATVIITCCFLIYAGVMLWLGRRALARFQATGSLAGDDVLTDGPDVLPRALTSALRCRPRGPVLNLFRKEFRLLRLVWLVTALTSTGWAGLTLLQLIHANASTKIFQTIVVSMAAVGTLIIAILAGSLSLGEEQTSGTHAWQMALPIPALLQWSTKLFMGLFASLLGAWLLPVLIAGRSLFVSPNAWEGRHFGFSLLIVVLLLTFAAFWCACAVKGTVRAVLWVVPVTVALYFAGKLGNWAGLVLTKLFFVRFDPFANGKLAHAVACFGSNAFFKLSQAAASNITDSVQAELVLTTILLVPTLLFAVMQSYRLFRAQPHDRDWSVIRSLVPLALVAFFCNFALLAFDVSVGRATRPPRLTALFESMQAIQKLQSALPKLDAAHPLQLTVENLARSYPLSKSTRRLLGNSHITLSLDAPPHRGHFGCATNLPPRGISALRYSWYSAVVTLADGSRFFVDFEPEHHSFMSAGFCK